MIFSWWYSAMWMRFSKKRSPGLFWAFWYRCMTFYSLYRSRIVAPRRPSGLRGLCGLVRPGVKLAVWTSNTYSFMTRCFDSASLLCLISALANAYISNGNPTNQAVFDDPFQVLFNEASASSPPPFPLSSSGISSTHSFPGDSWSQLLNEISTFYTPRVSSSSSIISTHSDSKNPFALNKNSLMNDQASSNKFVQFASEFTMEMPHTISCSSREPLETSTEVFNQNELAPTSSMYNARDNPNDIQIAQYHASGDFDIFFPITSYDASQVMATDPQYASECRSNQETIKNSTLCQDLQDISIFDQTHTSDRHGDENPLLDHNLQLAVVPYFSGMSKVFLKTNLGNTIELEPEQIELLNQQCEYFSISKTFSENLTENGLILCKELSIFYQFISNKEKVTIRYILWKKI